MPQPHSLARSAGCGSTGLSAEVRCGTSTYPRSGKLVAPCVPYFSGQVSSVVLDGFLRGRPVQERVSAERLTSREREIVQLLAKGNSNKAIASASDLSIKTVETHRASIMRKLELKSFADIVRFAIRNRIIEA